MDRDRPLNDLLSECESLGSDCCLSSQPQKISRGILVDSGANFRPKSIKEDAVALTEECKNPLHVEENEKHLQSVNDGNNGKQSQALKQETSLLSTRAFDKKISISEAHNMSDGATEAKLAFSLSYANLEPGVEGNARPQSQPRRVISGSKDVNAEITNKLSFAPVQPIIAENKADKTEIRGSETLRVSLWKILETVSSPHKQHLSDCNLKNEGKESDSFRKNNEEVYPVLKSVQHSDTIESDSDCPNHSLCRSLGRKRASSKLKRNRRTEPSVYNHNDKRRKKGYPSREEYTAGLSVQKACGSPILEQKGERQRSTSDARNMLFNEQKNQGENLQENSRRQSVLNSKGDNNRFYCWENSEFIEPKNVGVEKGSVQCPLGNTSEHPWSMEDSPKLQENVECPKDLGHSPLSNTICQKSYALSPTFILQTPTKSPTCSPTCEMKIHSKGLSSGSPFKYVSILGCGGLDDHSHWEKSGIKGFKSFKRFLVSRQNDYLLDSQMNISPAVEEKSAKGILELMTENSDSEAFEQDRDSEASEEDPVMRESRSPENALPAKEASVLHQDKKQSHQYGFRVIGFSSNLASEKGTSRRHLVSADQQDELARSFALFSLALERVKSKMKSVARKRSAEILMFAADRIHLQLQNAESHILADLRKLNSFGKSNKKRLEMRCGELRRELNFIHQSLKEGVNKHLQNCKSTVEVLDAQQLELKVTLEKQRASHRKLLLQAEEAIEADLNDAQKRISAIQNLAKGKMLELKNIVTDLLKEGIIT